MAVDVFVPVYKEPVDIVDLTVAAAAGLRGAEVRVWVLDDGNDDTAMRDLAGPLRHGLHPPGRAHRREGGQHQQRPQAHERALHRRLRLRPRGGRGLPGGATLGYMDDPYIAFVQTPQYYANADQNRSPRRPGPSSALFFGAIARGKDGLDPVFCCGTNVLFRREAFEERRGLFRPTRVTEDYELSIWLHEAGWKGARCRRCSRGGLGPEDMAAYVSQQQRWARGCLSGLPRALRARLPLKLKAAVRAVGDLLPLRVGRS